MGRLEDIRLQEKLSHTETYTKHELYHQGSWLQKPVKTVLDLFPLFEGYSDLYVLDLGCGVGRNSIAIARHFKDIACHIDCIDLLEIAIEKLQENANTFQASSSINAITIPLEAYPIKKNSYDLILGISALEHTESEEAFVRTLENIRVGTRKNGVICLIINSSVQEFNKQTGREVPAQFEVNLEQAKLQALLDQIFGGWTVLKSSVQEQRYDIPRGSSVSNLHTKVVTFVAKNKERGQGPPLPNSYFFCLSIIL